MSFVQARDKIIQNLKNEAKSFPEIALDVFRLQAKHNYLYKSYLELLSVHPDSVSKIEEIPFLPIQFFKNYEIKTGAWLANAIFSSSGTTAKLTSKHHIQNLEWYHYISRKGFEEHYGKVENYCFLALLPSYLERKGSSLVYMVDYFIQLSKQKESGFFLYEYDKLVGTIQDLKNRKIPTVLIGVSFALLDLAEKYQIDLGHIIAMETGGMKGRRKEITRNELHQILGKAFDIKAIHSEYGMTELLSQAYSKANGIFYPSSTMCVLTREITDPLYIQKNSRTGGINIIDLANIDTISFIATDDLGRVYPDGSFEILGRLDASDIRGCNLIL